MEIKTSEIEAVEDVNSPRVLELKGSYINWNRSMIDGVAGKLGRGEQISVEFRKRLHSCDEATENIKEVKSRIVEYTGQLEKYKESLKTDGSRVLEIAKVIEERSVYETFGRKVRACFENAKQKWPVFAERFGGNVKARYITMVVEAVIYDFASKDEYYQSKVFNRVEAQLLKTPVLVDDGLAWAKSVNVENSDEDNYDPK